MARITVLGAGLVGALVATELSEDHYIKVIDPDQEALVRVTQLAPAVELHDARFDSPAQLADCDLALNCLPGSVGHAALRRIIAAGVDCVDISFTAEDPRTLDTVAREAGVTIVPDAGIAPGFSNLLAAERWADEPTFWNGLPPAAMHAEASRWILGMIDRTATIGHYAYDSTGYHNEHYIPYLALAEYARDPHVRRQAR